MRKCDCKEQLEHCNFCPTEQLQVGDEVIYFDVAMPKNGTTGKVCVVKSILGGNRIRTCCTDKGIELYLPIGRFKKVINK